MFKNRKLVIRMDKDEKKHTDGVMETRCFEEKTAFVLRNLENFAAKAFVGMCIYIVLDTRRRVRVAEAIYGQNNE